jgi:hypothetical protein
MEAQAAGAAAACRCRCIVESSCWGGGGGMANSSDEMDSSISVAVGTLCCAERRKKSLQIHILDLAATGMVVGVDVRSENSSLLSARTRARVNSKASRILVPVVLSVFAVALLACSYSAASSSRNVQLAETSNVGEQVLTAIAHVSSKSGKLHSEAAQLQAADNTIRQTLARDSVDASADEHAIHKYSQEIDVTKPLLAANSAIVARLQASIKAADQGILAAKSAMIAAEAAEASDKKDYLKVAAPWQKVQKQEALAQKKYRADEQQLKRLVKKAAADPADSYSAERLADVEKKLHSDRKAARSGSIDIDKLGVLANQETLVENLNKAQSVATNDISKYRDLVNKKGADGNRLVAEQNKVAHEKARLAADQRMLAHFKDLLTTVDAEEKRETSQKLKVMSRINELVASAPTVPVAKAANTKSSSTAKK